MGATVLTSALFTSCKDNAATDELVGTYAFTGASLVSAIEISLNGTDPGSLDAGETTYSSLFVTNGLYDPQLTPCTDANNTRSELTSDGKLLLVCAGETGQKTQGSWSISEDRKTLSLTINAEFTSSGTALEIIINNVTFNGVTLSGTITNFPLPKNLAPSLTLGQTIPTGYAYAGQVNYQVVQLNVSFTRVSL